MYSVFTGVHDSFDGEFAVALTYQIRRLQQAVVGVVREQRPRRVVYLRVLVQHEVGYRVWPVLVEADRSTA